MGKIKYPTFSQKYPDLIAEWSERNGMLAPESITCGSNRKIWWKCSLGHEWQESVKKRMRGDGCPICSGRRVLVGYNDLQTTSPELAREWSPKNGDLQPEDFTNGAHAYVWWKGPCGHEWQAEINSRYFKESGCPYCSGRKVLPGFNDLQTRYPEVAAQWSSKNSPRSPVQFTFGSSENVWWKGNCGHEWTTKIKDRTIRKSGCPFCTGHQVLKGFNDLKTRYPKIAEQWSNRNGGLQPDQVLSGSNRKVWWKCELDHEWSETISARTGSGYGCPYCSNKRVLQGFNDCKTLFPHLQNEWSEKNRDCSLSDFTRGSRKKVWWNCQKCGHEWVSSIYQRTKGSMCPMCQKESLIDGGKSFAYEYQELASEWSSRNGFLKPFDVRWTYEKAVWWKCKACGHEWKSVISHRLHNPVCPACLKLEIQLVQEQQRNEQESKMRLTRNIHDVLIGYLAKKNGFTLFRNHMVDGICFQYYFPDQQAAIELYKYNSWTATGRRKESLVNEYCLDKRITMVRIQEHGLDPYPNCQCIRLKREDVPSYKTAINIAFESIGASMVIDFKTEWEKIVEYYLGDG